MFKSISPYELTLNPFEAIDRQWMLITAGNEDSCNTMTASWGGLGILWHKPVATAYIRPQRYTLGFVDREEYFSLCFFGGEQREALTLCGRVSGRDVDKIAQSGLTLMHDKAAPYFAEAKTVLICRKLHRQMIDPEGFVDSTIEKEYPAKDYHAMFIAEITEVMVAQ